MLRWTRRIPLLVTEGVDVSRVARIGEVKQIVTGGTPAFWTNEKGGNSVAADETHAATDVQIPAPVEGIVLVEDPVEEEKDRLHPGI